MYEIIVLIAIYLAGMAIAFLYDGRIERKKEQSQDLSNRIFRDEE